MQTMTNEEIIWDFLYKRLKNPYGTAGLMGNLFAESSLNPTLANGVKKKTGMTNAEYTAAVDKGTYTTFTKDSIAYGLAQWCYAARKEKLYAKIKSLAVSVGDINGQLEYLWEELQGYKTVISTLYSAKTIREASDIVLTRYEKPANQSEGVKQMRARYGQNYYDKYYKEPVKDTVQFQLKTETAKKLFKYMEKINK